MSKQEKFPDASEYGRKYDVNDLIFRFNCAKHFRTPTNTTNTNEKLAASRRDAHYREEVKFSQCQTLNFRDEDTHQKNIFMKGNNKETSQMSALGIIGTVDAPRKLLEMQKKGLSCQAHYKTSVPSLPNVVSSSILPTEIVVAVDATPTRVGGLLRLPGKERTIFYYSIDWTSRFEINDSTKFEMINTALALELFDPYLKAYRARYDNFIVKTDSHFYESIKGFKDPYDFEFLIGVREKVESFKGTFQHAVISQKDPDIQNADYLSRTELPMDLKIRYYCKSDSQCTENDTVIDYALVDLSSVAKNYTLDVISEAVPGKYIRGYNYA